MQEKLEKFFLHSVCVWPSSEEHSEKGRMKNLCIFDVWPLLSKINTSLPPLRVHIFREGHTIWKNLPLRTDVYLLRVKFKLDFFSNFVAFLENLNFNNRVFYSRWILSFIITYLPNVHMKSTEHIFFSIYLPSIQETLSDEVELTLKKMFSKSFQNPFLQCI